jgi:arylsulfatase A-like enzyme
VQAAASEPVGWHRALRDAAVVGAFFGFAASTIEVMLWTVGRMQRGLATPRDSLLLDVALSTVIGLALGLAFSPIRRRAGHAWLLHPLAIFVAWAGLGFAAGLPSLPLYLTLTIVPWVVALLVVTGAAFLAERQSRLRRFPLVVLVVLVVFTLFAPPVAELARTIDGAAPSRYAPPENAPDVLLVVLDTVRADHVGAYGYDRDSTPVFDRLAREGTMFLDATAPATWSLPSHASLFTGTFPTTHGAHAEHRRLDASGPRTLAEVLADHGYETRCFTANAWFSAPLGLVRGFGWTDESWRRGRAGQTRLFALRLLDRLGFGARDNGGGAVADGFEAWVDDLPEGGAPRFTFVNFIEAHFPYHQVPHEHLERFTDADEDELRALSLALMEAQFGGEVPDAEIARGPATDMYDAGVHYADALLGRLVEALRARGRLDETLLVVLSDHGELLGEHGAFGHGASLHDEETRVPLLIRYPEAFDAGVTVETPVSTVGVFATVLDVVGITTRDTPEVGTLRQVVGGSPPGLVVSERYALREGTGGHGGDTPLFRRDARFRTYRDGELKLVLTDEQATYLYDLGSDAGETEDLAGDRPDDVARLEAQLRHLAAAAGLADLDGEPIDASDLTLDEETRERLRALGYLE